MRYSDGWISRFLWLLLTFQVLSLFSCIDLTIHGKLDKEGPVTIFIKIVAVDQVLQNALVESAEGVDSFPVFQKKKLVKQIQKLDGFLAVYKNDLAAGIRTLEVEVQLKHPEDVNKLNLLDIMKLDYQQDGSWLWRFGDVPLGTALGGMDETSLLQQIELLGPILKGMKLDLEFQVPEIIKTNLDVSAPLTASYKMDYQSMIEMAAPKARLLNYSRLLEAKYLSVANLPGPRPPVVKEEEKK